MCIVFLFFISGTLCTILVINIIRTTQPFILPESINE